MKLKPFSGRMWKVRAKDENGTTKWTVVVSETPEQAIKSFRWEFSGHDIEQVDLDVATCVILPD